MKNTAILLALSLISGPLLAQESDFFNFFNEEMEPKIEVNIKSLNYNRTENEDESQGSFSFDKFKILSDKTNLTLHNDSHFYDAEIYRRGQMIGFKGPAASFAYNMRDQDFKYLDSFKWMIIKNVYYYMDRSDISLKGDNIAMREPKTMLVTNNFDLNCDRHEGYQLNDVNGFLAGCLNYGESRPLDGQGIGVDFRFFDDNEKKIIDLQGYFKSVSFSQDKIKSDITSLSSNFSDEVFLNATEIDLQCTKPNDVLNVSPESLVVPCLNDLSVKGNYLSAKFLEDNDEMNILNPQINHFENVLTVDHENIKFKAVDSSFELTSSVLKCDIPENEDILQAETFLKGCLNSSELLRKSDQVSFNFKTWENEPKPFELDVSADVQKFTTGLDRVKLVSEKLKIEVDKALFIDFKQVDMDCQKVENLTSFDAKAILENCKKDLSIDVDTFLIRDYLDQTKPILVKTRPKTVLNRDNNLRIDLPELKLVDREDLTIMEDVEISCDTTGKVDVFIPNEIIGACVNKGHIKINKVFTDDSNLSVGSLLNPKTNIDNIKVEKKKPKIFDIDLQTRNGRIYGEIRIRVLGIKSRVEFSGPIKWDIDNEVLTIKVEKSRLPLGIKSENIFMYFVKKMLVAEMISYGKDKTIKISL